MKKESMSRSYPYEANPQESVRRHGIFLGPEESRRRLMAAAAIAVALIVVLLNRRKYHQQLGSTVRYNTKQLEYHSECCR